jgi:hypothetical protein
VAAQSANEYRPIRTVEELHAFFDSLLDESGAEEDWNERVRVIDESRRRGSSAT